MRTRVPPPSRSGEGQAAAEAFQRGVGEGQAHAPAAPRLVAEQDASGLALCSGKIRGRGRDVDCQAVRVGGRSEFDGIGEASAALFSTLRTPVRARRRDEVAVVGGTFDVIRASGRSTCQRSITAASQVSSG